MKKHKRISIALASASCALLGAGTVNAETPKKIGEWEYKAAVLFYSESDRVQALEPVIQAKKWLDTDESLSFKLVLDSLTGASASGAVPTDSVQTFTRPSGNASYAIQAGDTPLDDTFLDTRYALTGAWEKPLSRLTKMNLSANISKEYDYLSVSTSALFSHDINQRNTTLSAGVSLASDSISPEGDIPTPFAQMAAAGVAQPRDSADDTKTTVDLLLGITQVIDRNSLLQFNYSLSQSDGYHTDPFKVLSVVDDVNAANFGRPEFVAGTRSKALFEKRPDSRSKNSLYGQYKRNIDGDVLDLSYRYLFDDWGLTSHTIDFHYRFQTSQNSYWQPHLRYYMQEAVDFYQPFLLKSQVDVGTLPEDATADYRLGGMDAITVGLEYARNAWSLAAEYYLQTPDEPNGKFGELNNQELAPSIDAVMLRFNYDF